MASLVDSSLFIRSNHIHIFLLIYIDDIVITGTHTDSILHVIQSLQCKFPLKDLGPLGYFLGVQATRTSHGLHLCQSKYILDLLERVKMTGAKPYSALFVSGSKLSKFDGDLLSDPTEYRHVVGALQYCTITRPEIAYSVNQLCQHMHSPTSAHWTIAKHVLRYLKGSIDHSLSYAPGSLSLTTYSDVDWAGNPDD